MVYVITHKETKIPAIDGYVPLLAGAINHDTDYGYLVDSQGDNISSKNSNYCELTGLYWIWKNTDDDYVGLVHYRRFFSCSLGKEDYLNEKDIRRILKKYDVILPIKQPIKTNAREQYSSCGYDRDLDLLRDSIEELYPEYVDSFDRVMNSHNLYLFNMMITSREILCDYCEWLFGILLNLEPKVDISGYTDYQKRIYGFMSERLLNVYFDHNNMKVFQAGVVFDNNWGLIKHTLTGLKRKVYYIFQMLR